MINIGEMNDLAEDIIQILEKKDWISSIEIYSQSINRYKVISNYDNIEKKVSKQSGFSIRIISKSRRLSEISLNKSMVNSIKKLSEPKSTQKIIPVHSFPELKRPRITSIAGDEGKNIDFNRDFLGEMLESVSHINNDDISLVNRSLDILLENRLIINTGSQAIHDSSLKTDYQATYVKYQDGMIYSSSKSNFARNLDIDYTLLETKVRQSLINNLHFHPKFGSGDIKGVVLEPDILGKILSSMIYTILSQKSANDEIDCNNSFQIYDDPHKASGYSSIIFDDEGTLTRSNLILENGIIKNKLDDLQSTDWKSGGNGFRSSWYMPLLRSYKYPINRFFTNLSLYGGVGKGNKFIQRTGVILSVVSGQVSVQGNLDNLQFIIHGNETQFWKDGEFVGPGGNATITGKISDLLIDGSISSDLQLVIDKSIPGSVYCGWAHIQSRLVNISFA